MGEISGFLCASLIFAKEEVVDFRETFSYVCKSYRESWVIAIEIGRDYPVFK